MKRLRESSWLRHLDFIIADIVLLVAGQLLVNWIANRNFDFLHSRDFSTILAFVVMIDLIVILLIDPLRDVVQRGYWKEFTFMIRQFVLYAGLLGFFMYAAHVENDVPRIVMVYSFLLSFVAIYLVRCVMKTMIRRDITRSDNRNKMLLITTRDNIEGLWHAMTSKIYPDYRICAVTFLDCNYDTLNMERARRILRYENRTSFVERGFSASDILERDEKDVVNISILCGMEDTNEYIRQQVVDEVYLDCTYGKYPWAEQIQDYVDAGITVHIGIPGEAYDYPNRSISNYGGRLALTTSRKQAFGWKLNLKRAIDICGALVGLVITGIACIFVVPAIKLADPGPVFFAQTRVGRNGRPFRFYKFRSMYMDAEERKAELMAQNQMQGLMFKLENDPRIIGSEKGPGKGIGNFIRKTSIDELPQFWNILKGDMSLVGTRPPTYGEYQEYEMRHKARLSMRPGLTGLWQVSGRSNITDFEEVVKLDCEYIENWTLGLDFKILLKTVQIVFQEAGAR